MCHEPQGAQALEFRPMFMGMFYTHAFRDSIFDTRVEFNMFLAFVIIVAEHVEV